MRVTLVLVATALFVALPQAPLNADTLTPPAAAAADAFRELSTPAPEESMVADEETTIAAAEDGPEGGRTFVPLGGATARRLATMEGESFDKAAAQTWAACGVFDKSTKIVRTFPRYRASAGGQYIPGGTSNLACGSDNWGYRHIKLRHLSQWEEVASYSGQNWRDTADEFIAGALIDPDVVTYRKDNDTFAYCRQMYLIDKRSGRPVGVSYPRVVVAHVTKNIITSYPDSKHC